MSIFILHHGVDVGVACEEGTDRSVERTATASARQASLSSSKETSKAVMTFWSPPVYVTNFFTPFSNAVPTSNVTVSVRNISCSTIILAGKPRPEVTEITQFGMLRCPRAGKPNWSAVNAHRSGSYMTRNEYPGVESPRYVGTPSHASLTGAFSASVGRSRVGNGVSVSVAAGVFVGAGVNVSVGGSGVGEWISPPNG